jgi:uncharacterized damage-inducible protein DinB
MMKRPESIESPQYPAGPFVPEQGYGRARREEFIKEIERAPEKLRKAILGLSDTQLDTRYRNWTIRQIAHHLVDSHINSYVRFRLALTEDRPTIKPYDEARWVMLEDARAGDLKPSLMLLEGLHSRLVLLLRSMSDEQFDRAFFHPETGQVTSLSDALCYYAWHCRHHVGQIEWLRAQKGWS